MTSQGLGGGGTKDFVMTWQYCSLKTNKSMMMGEEVLKMIENYVTSFMDYPFRLDWQKINHFVHNWLLNHSFPYLGLTSHLSENWNDYSLTLLHTHTQTHTNTLFLSFPFANSRCVHNLHDTFLKMFDWLIILVRKLVKVCENWQFKLKFCWNASNRGGTFSDHSLNYLLFVHFLNIIFKLRV